MKSAKVLKTLSFFTVFITSLVSGSQLLAQCETEVDGVLYYCRPENPDSFFVGFHIKGDPGTYNVIDRYGNVPDNQGIRVSDISTETEPASYSIMPVQLTVSEPNEYWYFGPFENGSIFDIVVIETSNMCDTIPVDFGTYTCEGQRFTGCENPDSTAVPYYHIIFTHSHLDSCLIIARERGLGCGNCTGGMGNTTNKRCFEFKIEVGMENIGVQVKDVGPGATAGELYWAFNFDENTCDSLRESNPGGMNNSVVCTYDNPVVYMLSCKQGQNATSISLMDIPSVNAHNLILEQPCDSLLVVSGADMVSWSSPDDPNLDNLWNCSVDSLTCSFLYNAGVFGNVMSCAGDTFMYIAAASPLDMVCLAPDTIIYDTAYVVVFPIYDVSISKNCIDADSVQLNAVVNSVAIGCDYKYLWSNGDTTGSIRVLADRSDYSVTVVRSQFTDVVDPCFMATASDSAYFEMQVVCDLMPVSVQCMGDIPDTSYTGIGVVTCGMIDTMVVEENNGGSGCASDPLIIQRHFIFNDGINTDTCTQVITVADNLPPTFTAPRDTVIRCELDSLPSRTGMVTDTADLCSSGIQLSYRDEVVPGVCPAIDTIYRWWRAEDRCQNADSALQVITRIDTVPPVIQCPDLTFEACEMVEADLMDLDSFLHAGGVISDNCHIDSTSFHGRLEINGNDVIQTYYISDACGLTDSCVLLGMRLQTEPPVAVCHDTLTFEVPLFGPVILTVDTVDNGSYDDCGIDTMYLSRYTFDCGNVFDTTVYDQVDLIVVDQAGFRDTCTTILRLNCPCNPYQPLVCFDKVTVGIGPECETTFPIELFARGYAPECRQVLLGEVFNQWHQNLGNVLTEELLNQKLYYQVTNTLTKNKCWGELRVELNPNLPEYLFPDTTISCTAPLPALPAIGLNCSVQPQVTILSEEYTSYDCDEDPELIGFITRRIRIEDAWGRSAVRTQQINLRKVGLSAIIFPADTLIECCSERTDPLTHQLVSSIWDSRYSEIDPQGYPHPLPKTDGYGRLTGVVMPPYAIDGPDTVYLTKESGGTCRVFTDYTDRIIPTCGNSFKIRREWLVADWCAGRDTTVVQWIEIIDTLGPQVNPASLTPLTVLANPHDCSADVFIRRPVVVKECGYPDFANQAQIAAQLKVYFEINQDGGLVAYGQIAPDEVAVRSLPAGYYTITYHLRDACNNKTDVDQALSVVDESGPVPVCGANSRVTMDANTCSHRLNAVSLDDGSFDNCCGTLHFAVARMEDLNYWTDYWNSQLKSCLGTTTYNTQYQQIQAAISQWLDCYVYAEYVDLTDCGEEMVVMKVYQACGLPNYDPHAFAGDRHQWYCWNVYDDYACFYKLNYPAFLNGERPHPDLCHTWDLENHHGLCEYTTGEEMRWEAIASQYPGLQQDFEDRVLIPVSANVCMVNVFKDDKQAPVCVPPQNITVYCDQTPWSGSFDQDGASRVFSMPENTSAISCAPPAAYPWDGGTYGYYQGILDGDDCMSTSPKTPIYCQMWLWLDRYDTTSKPLDLLVVVPDVHDNCTPANELIISSRDSGRLDECGTGSVSRTWTVADRCGNSTQCTQTLTVLARSDFEVLFPKDTTYYCGSYSHADLDPETSGNPVLSDDECELLGVTRIDEVLGDSTQGCFSIIRHWKVIDWCTYDQTVDPMDRNPDVIVDDRYLAGPDRSCVPRYLKDNGDGSMEYVQIIHITDTTPPVVECVSPSVVCIEDDQCVVALVRVLLGGAADNCTDKDKIRYQYHADTAGSAGPVLSGTGNEFEGEMVLDVPYRFHLIAIDICGNSDSCETTITVRDCKAPTVFCNDAITVLMGPDGQLNVDASSFDANSFDNCTSVDDLLFSFTPDGLTPDKTFTCADIPNGIVRDTMLPVYVLDKSGNVSQCTPVLHLEDGAGDYCPDNAPLVAPMDDESKSRVPHERTSNESLPRQYLGQNEGQILENNPVLLQNNPNPFSNTTRIAFILPGTMNATIRILDLAGKEVYKVSRKFVGGLNELFIEEHDLPAINGVLYYQLETELGVINKRMVRVQ
ncbi:MAG: T9SS type A sorting domain-containing protein [Saprospiraceae bacterium]|nr:T9SS type A sorting domain-containing protein [Saprospiraceae bacterium]MCB9320586.1 T9SS type A sorting domain-containing protein [Lewinellaceae bacterium]